MGRPNLPLFRLLSEYWYKPSQLHAEGEGDFRVMLHAEGNRCFGVLAMDCLAQAVVFHGHGFTVPRWLGFGLYLTLIARYWTDGMDGRSRDAPATIP